MSLISLRLIFVNIRRQAFALTAAGLLLASSGVAGAQVYSLGALEVDNPYAIETPPAARSAAGYLSVTNHGTRRIGLSPSGRRCRTHKFTRWKRTRRG